MSLHPQIEQLVAVMNEAGRPRIFEIPVEESRAVYRAMPAMMGELGFKAPSADRVIPGPRGDVPIRVYTPEGSAGRPVVVFYHGGGFCIGDLESHDRECQAISAKSNCVVVAVDYRMGPEHAYAASDERPAWIDDAWAAFTWVADNGAELDGDTDRLVVCGDSAGANISAVIAQMARDNDRALALQLLVYPVTDGREEAFDIYPSYGENAEAPILDRPTIDFFIDQARDGGDQTAPAASPGLVDDLSNLAPAVVVTAEHDPLRDDGEAYAKKLTDAGVAVTLKRFDGMPHGFFSLGPFIDASVEVIDDLVAAIDNVAAIDTVS